MKQIILVFFFIGLSVSSFSQNPSGLEGMKYQAVVRDAQGGILKNQPVSFRFSIIEGASVPVYIETHLLTTNEFGLVNLVIGRGSVSQGIFVDISWTVGSYFIEVEMDATGGSNYKLLSTSEVLSVPYAQFAGNVIYTDTSAINEIQTISLNNDTLYLSNGGFVDLKSYNTTTDLNGINARLDADSIRLNDHESKLELRRLADSAIVSKMVLDSINMQRDINKNKTDISNHLANDLDIDSTNEIQSLSGTTSGNNQTIVLDKSGGSVSFSTNDADSDTTNEIQDLKLQGNILTISRNGTATQIDLSPYLDNIDSQQLSIQNDTLKLDSSGSVDLKSYKQNLQVADSGLYRNISISSGNKVSFSISDGDTSSSNEYQDLSSSITNDSAVVNISNGKSTSFSIRDIDSDTSNEIQSLTMSNDTLFLSDGGFVKLPLGGGKKGINELLRPQGLSNEIVNLTSGASGGYTVPNGKFLYLLSDLEVTIDNNYGKHRALNLILKSGQKLTYSQYDQIGGFLTNSISHIEPIQLDTVLTYTVPSNKIFVMTSFYKTSTSSTTGLTDVYRFKVNQKDAHAESGSPYVFASGVTISATNFMQIGGYLIDENSFVFEPAYVKGFQVLSIDADTLSISDGNKVLIPSKWDSVDSSLFTTKQVGIGTSTPDSSAILDVQSTSKGFLPPKMTKAQNNNIVNPSDGLIIYRTDTIPGLYLFQDSTWNKIEIQKNGSNNKTLIYTNDGF